MAIKTVEQGSAEIFRKTINDNFSELEVLSGNGPPSNETVGALGQSYLDTQAKRVYKCTNVEDGKYTWVSQYGSGVIISEEEPEYSQIGDIWYQIV